MNTAGLDRAALRNVAVVINAKGGVGKTSTSASWAALAAAAGYRVLLVDLDPQANLGQEFGYQPFPWNQGNNRVFDGVLVPPDPSPETGEVPVFGRSDGGRGLTTAVQYGDPGKLYILRDVRPGLDVIPSGPYVEDLTAVLRGRLESGPANPHAGLAEVLSAVAGGYDLVVLDSPPGHRVVQKEAARAAHFMLIPAKSDESSLNGLAGMAEVFATARDENPTLQLLGVVLFGMSSGAIRKEATTWVIQAIGTAAPVFEPHIRHAERVAVEVRRRGRLPHELEELKPAALAKAATNLASDYEQLIIAILTRFNALLTAELAETEAVHG